MLGKQRKRPAGGIYKEPKRFVTAKRKAAPPPGSSSRGEDAEDGGGEASDAGEEIRVPIKRSVRASTKNKVRRLLLLLTESLRRVVGFSPERAAGSTDSRQYYK